MPPAFVLSQDQTLHRDLDHTRGWGHDHEESPDRPLADRQLELLEKTSLSAPRRARRGTPALAFGINCSVFKEPRPDGRPTEAGEVRRADTHSAAARSGATSSVRVKCSSRRENPPASGPIRLWVVVFTVKRYKGPERSRSPFSSAHRARIRTQDRRPSRSSRPSTSAGATARDGSVTRSSAR